MHRECPQIEVGTSLPAARVIAVLEGLAAKRGLPKSLIVDHGPEFILRALDISAYRRGIQLAFIRPGKPTDNAYIESVHSRFLDECLSVHWFLNLADARFQIEAWRRRGGCGNVAPDPGAGVTAGRCLPSRSIQADHPVQFTS